MHNLANKVLTYTFASSSLITPEINNFTGFQKVFTVEFLKISSIVCLRPLVLNKSSKNKCMLKPARSIVRIHS